MEKLYIQIKIYLTNILNLVHNNNIASYNFIGKSLNQLFERGNHFFGVNPCKHMVGLRRPEPVS